QDTDDLADVLEVYQLCLLLGFQGRYGGTGSTERRGWTTAVADKLARIRGGPRTLSPAWSPPGDEVIPLPKDPWVRPLGYAAATGCSAAGRRAWCCGSSPGRRERPARRRRAATTSRRCSRRPRRGSRPHGRPGRARSAACPWSWSSVRRGAPRRASSCTRG